MDIRPGTGADVARTARAFTRLAETRLRPLGLGVASVPVLVHLAQEGPLTQAQIAARLGVEQPSAATLLQRMTRDGLVERDPDPHDRRAVRISLSARAEQAMPGALAERDRADAQATAGLSGDEVTVLRALLARVRDNLAAVEDEERAATVGSGP